jgi:hypothetical protein
MNEKPNQGVRERKKCCDTLLQQIVEAHLGVRRRCSNVL